MIEIPKNLQKHLPEAVILKMSSMTELNQLAYLAEFRRRKKSSALAWWIMLPLGCHYAYVGKWWVTLIFVLTVGGLGVWWFIDLFRTVGLVRAYNKSLAIVVLRDIQILA